MNLSAGFFLSFAFLALTWKNVYSQGSWIVKKSFAAPSTETNGLAWDGEHLWHSYNYSPGYIYEIDTGSGRVLKKITTNINNPGDLTWLKGFLWVVDEGDWRLYKVDPADGKILDFIEVGWDIPGHDTIMTNGEVEGVESDGTCLWADWSGTYFFQMDPDTKKTVWWYKKTWSGYADGMTFAYNDIYCVTNEFGIIQLDPCTGAKIYTYVEPSGQGTWGPEGMTFDGQYWWYADNDQDIIYQIELTDDYQTKRRSLNKTHFVCSDTVAGKEKEAAFKQHFACNFHPNPSYTGNAIIMKIASPSPLPSSISILYYTINGSAAGAIKADNMGGNLNGIYHINGLFTKGAPKGIYIITFTIDKQIHAEKLLYLD